VDGRSAAALVVWASSIVPERLPTLVMVVVSGTLKNALAIVARVQLLVPTLNSPNGVLAQYLACLQTTLHNSNTSSTALITESLELVLVVLLLNLRRKTATPLLLSVTGCALWVTGVSGVCAALLTAGVKDVGRDLFFNIQLVERFALNCIKLIGATMSHPATTALGVFGVSGVIVQPHAVLLPSFLKGTENVSLFAPLLRLTTQPLREVSMPV